ncbi:MAG: hypothetical protein ABFD52_09350 [Acidobacteriota bacterium]
MRVKGKVRAAFIRRTRGLIKGRKKMNEHFDENSPVLFMTTFENNSELPWQICEDGDALFQVQPGKIARLESWKPTTNWARWSKVVRGKDLRLTLTENPAWTNPWLNQHYCLELENWAGAPVESIRVYQPTPIRTSAADYVDVLLDVPRIIPLNIWDELIRYKKIIWKIAPVKIRITGTNYVRTEDRPIKECVPRDKSDLKNVLKERQRLEVDALKERQEKMEEEREALTKKLEQDLLGA